MALRPMLNSDQSTESLAHLTQRSDFYEYKEEIFVRSADHSTWISAHLAGTIELT